MNLLASNEVSEHPFTGELTEDSVLISYNDLRIVNSKLVELKYEKDINKSLKDVITNDTRIISRNDSTIKVLQERNRQVVKQKNIFEGTAIGAIITLIITLLVK